MNRTEGRICRDLQTCCSLIFFQELCNGESRLLMCYLNYRDDERIRATSACWFIRCSGPQNVERFKIEPKPTDV
jgi:hypothetical protein